MTTHLVTFSDESMSRAARLCMESATRNGVDYVGYWPHDAPADHPRRTKVRGLKQTTFYKQNEALLSQPRGLGFWAWKPYIIGKSMKSLSDGDTLIYADAGIEFIAPVQHIIDRMSPMETRDLMLLPEAKASTGGPSDVWLFGNNWEHAHWCKADVVHELWPYPVNLPPPGFASFCPPMEPDNWKRGWDLFGKQVQASVIFFRVSDYSRQFVAEWLKWCLFDGGRLIDDSPSIAPNHPEFREHRHDQAILTTLAYREGIPLHFWPASYNDGAFTYEKLPEYTGDDYPVLFHHHRRRDHEWK